MWWVYVLQSEQPRWSRGKKRPGFFYVGSTTDPARRLREHNGVIKGGGRYTSKHRPWKPRALFGPYTNRSEGFRAEKALKRKRGWSRVAWRKQDSAWCRGQGSKHPWVLNPSWTADPPEVEPEVEPEIDLDEVFD
jgi:predicted GIY-YIG superfamily endonuclease